MKKTLIIIAAVAGSIFTSCNNHKSEIAQLNKEKDSLVSVAYTKDQTINDFLSSFSEIQGNLAEVTQKQNAIAMNSGNNPESIHPNQIAPSGTLLYLALIYRQTKNILMQASIFAFSEDAFLY